MVFQQQALSAQLYALWIVCMAGHMWTFTALVVHRRNLAIGAFYKIDLRY